MLFFCCCFFSLLREATVNRRSYHTFDTYISFHVALFLMALLSCSTGNHLLNGSKVAYCNAYFIYHCGMNKISTNSAVHVH